MTLPSDWIDPPDLKTATRAQREIAEAAETRDRFAPAATVAGADTSMRWRDSRGPIHAAIARSDGTAWTATLVPRFAYVPGCLGFRECPALLAAWDAIDDRPELLFVDGQGRAHPRRCGIATQLGVLLDRPTIGVAKSLLCGRVEDGPGPTVGDTAPVIDRGEIVALALRTRARAAPIYVSTGHRVSLESAVELVLAQLDGRRLPPPIRAAHDAANAARRAWTTMNVQNVQ